METPPEKHAVLKRVYAEIILNTTKESAARVLAADRRALAAEAGIAAAKEEAVATLCRLKSLMDTELQIREAETTSLGRLRKIEELAAQLSEAETLSLGRLRKNEVLEAQLGEAETVSLGRLRKIEVLEAQLSEAETVSLDRLRKIEVLEAQLDEAEDIICSLRSDLKIANKELRKKKNPIAELLYRSTNGHETTCVNEHQERGHSSDPALRFPVVSGHNKASDNGTTLIQKNLEGHPCSLEHAMQEESMEHLSAENEFVSNPDLASIILGGKKLEPYRNGCTQRIRALEQNILPAEVSRGQNDEQPMNLKRALVIRDDERIKRLHRTDYAMAGEIVTELNYSESQVSISMTANQTFAENPHSFCESNSETSSLPHINPDVRDEDNRAPIDTALVGNSFKYTFQRRRKRESANDREDDSLFVEKSAWEMSGDEQNDFQEHQKPSLVTQLPRKNRRLLASQTTKQRPSQHAFSD